MDHPRQLTPTDHSRDSAGLRYVYPVVSRRAGGVSIGINLNPNNACNWHCIYCQVPDLQRGSAPPVDLALLESELRGFIEELRYGEFMTRRVPADARHVVDIALSGNGEPTSAAEFPDVIELVDRVRRDSGLPSEVVVRVITNGSLVSRPEVQRGLRRLGEIGGEAWLKVDAGSEARIRQINGVALSRAAMVRNLARCAGLCRTWVQTCVFALDGRGPTERDVDDYLSVLRDVGADKLAGVHLYGLARPSMQEEAKRLSRLPEAALEAVAARIRALGLTVTVSP